MQLLNAISNFFISNAYADTPASATSPTGGGFTMVVMLVALVAFMYLVVWRPQQKAAKEQKEIISSLSMGDEVVTAGGILGRIVKVNENYVILSLNDTNVEMTIQKTSVVRALPKGTIKSI